MKKLLLASVMSVAMASGAFAWSGAGSSGGSGASGSSAVIGGPNSLAEAGGFANAGSMTTSSSTLSPHPSTSVTTSSYQYNFSGQLSLGNAAGTSANGASAGSSGYSYIHSW